ncbi:hypothetical protein CR513_10061, partial [Mucuna pruriens]
MQLNKITPWFADICNFIVASQLPPKASQLYKEKLKSDAKYYIWDDPYLWRLYNDQILRSNRSSNFVMQHLEVVTMDQLRQPRKCLIPTICRDAYQFVSTYEQCQEAGMAISRRLKMHQQPILFCEIFNVWGIDFMGPFPVSNRYSYILLAINYVSRWVEAIATKTKDAKVVVNFLKSNIICWFGVSKALISDQRSHFCNRAMSFLLDKYGVVDNSFLVIFTCIK